ncbi:MAG: glycerol-3-phosphate 1-O-acyltransferase PlsY [Pseudomonadota bacterium]
MLHELMAPERALPWFALAFSVGYLAGSIPFGLILARVFRLGDLRNIGSGNIGATNVMRTGNKLAAALTLLLDGLKGALPVLFFLGWGDLAAQFAGVGAFVGHCLPVWLRFRGGKGVATFFGIALALYWPAGLTLAAVWLGVFKLTRTSAVAALVAATTGPIAFFAWGRLEAVLAMAVLGLAIWLTHRSNIARLRGGQENRF